MSRTKDVSTLQDRIEDQKKQFLIDNGWKCEMYRWYWVWKKESWDATHMQFSVDDAILVEGCLQGSNECYQPEPSEERRES